MSYEGKLLLKINAESDKAVANKRWPALSGFRLETGDEIRSFDPPAPNMKAGFAVMRNGAAEFQCAMEAASKQRKK